MDEFHNRNALHRFVASGAGLLMFAAPFAIGIAMADDAACAQISAANLKWGAVKGGKVSMTKSGVDFAKATPQIYGFGAHTCSFLRDENVAGEAAAVYSETYTADVGSTHAQIWVSKKSGLLLKEEEDGDVKGKGKGHISGLFSGG